MKDKKFKPLSKEQIIISIDRLTRFKFTEQKYLRVFKDIILSNLIEPKFKKSELDNMAYETLRELAEFVFNSSFENKNLDLSINCRLNDYENKLFNLDKDTKKLLENRLNYKDAITFLQGELPYNLKWLSALAKEEDLVLMREKYSLKHPLTKIVIAEGITEEILLPRFARLCGYDFNKAGVYVISAGGKNQVVKSFYNYVESLKLPIFILLDKDAQDNFESIKPRLRKFDKVHLLNSGEFEDLLPLGLIQRTINSELVNFASVTQEELNQSRPMVKILEDIFKEKGLHEFKKAEFASRVAQNLQEKDVSQEIAEVIDEIMNLSPVVL